MRLDDQVSPLQRRISSVTGLDMSILELPRAVTAINAAQIRDQSIISVTDFLKVASSAYTTDQFGGANVPWLRGQPAEVFQNGMQRTPRSDGQPLSFNGVEGFDVVKGPAGVVYGPTGSVGGYVNLVTKRPAFDRMRATTTLTYGDYNTRRGQIDVTGPISDTLAYRVSYEAENPPLLPLRLHAFPGCVRGTALQAESRPHHRLQHRVLLGAIHREHRLQPPDAGAHPPRLYYTGTATGAFRPPSFEDPRGFLGTIDVTGAVHLPRNFQLVAPDDHDSGSNLQGQLDVTYRINDTWTISNKTYYEDYTQLQLEYAQRYFNDIRESFNFENRFELRGTFDSHQFITGLAYRNIHVLAYQDFFNEYLNATDLSSDPATYPIVEGLFGVVPVPGRPAGTFAAPGARYPSPLYPFAIQGTQKQNSYQIGAFFQDLWAITDQLSLLAGVRADTIHESLTDALPPPGFAPAHDTAARTNGRRT